MNHNRAMRSMDKDPVRSPRTSAPRGVRRLRPEVEALEDRLLPSCNCIAGFVYHDLNNNGLYDRSAGETPIAGSQLELRNASNVVVATARTDANGYYQFTTDRTVSTAPQTLTYTAVFPSAPTNYTLARAVAQFDPRLGTLLAVDVVQYGSITSTIQVENSSTTSASTITGTVSGKLTLQGPGFTLETNPSSNAGTFNASTFDGTTDFRGASGMSFAPRTASSSKFLRLSGQALQAFRGTGTVSLRETAVATSTATGGGNVLVSLTSRAAATVTVTYRYIPNNCLMPGTYRIVQVPQPSGYLDGKESRGGTVLAGSVGTDSIQVTLGSTNLHNNNFGEVRPATISGYVYRDTGEGFDDGIKGNDEPGIAGIGVHLIGTDDRGVSVNRGPIATDANGFYRYELLRPGVYTLVEAQPDGYLDGQDTAGNKGGIVDDDRILNIRLRPGDQGVNYNFGELVPDTVQGNPDPVVNGQTYPSVLAPQAQFPAAAPNLLGKGDLFSSPDAASATDRARATYVDALYRTLLGRPASASEMINAISQFRQGTSRQQIVQSLWSNAEHRRIQAHAYYSTFLQRTPSESEIQSLVAPFAAGANEMGVAINLVVGAEYTARYPDAVAFGVALHRDIVNFTADPAAFQAWPQLAATQGRAYLAQTVFTSEGAYGRIIETAYRNLLSRAPTRDELLGHLAPLRTGQTPPAGVVISLLASDEFYAIADRIARG